LLHLVGQAIGGDAGKAVVEVVTQFVADRFTDHSGKLGEALKKATARSWKTLEFALAGENLQRPVVIKTIQPDILDRDDQSLVREARVLMQFQHDAVVKLYDCDHADQAARARPYLVMEHFDSTNLEEYIHNHGTLNVADLRAVVGPVAEALRTAHEKGILHRDVKPANVLVRRDPSGWQVKLIDFGLALRHGTTASSASNNLPRAMRRGDSGQGKCCVLHGRILSSSPLSPRSVAKSVARGGFGACRDKDVGVKWQAGVGHEA
jgi:serine/threonine protein kinase